MTEIIIDKLIRSRRKTVSLAITHDGRLIVRAPLKTPVDYIRKLVLKKSSWIKMGQETLKERCKKNPPKKFVNGETFLFAGNKYQLKIVDDCADIELNGSLNFPRRLLPVAKDFLINWYKRQALIKISERVDWYAKLAGLNYKSIKITTPMKRLGSCGRKGTLNFNWCVVLAPLSIIDYVVVHELSHLEHMNHSRKFWDKVKTIMPDYEQRKKWLKDNSYLLTV